jgi:NTP pyrophosphatase (non-canonical NTP hydrolase)
MLDELTQEIVRFRDERDWKQFHSPKNLAVSMAIESAELMELFQWTRSGDEERKAVEERGEDLRDEVADVLIYALLLCHETGVDPVQAVRAKVDKNRANYPAERARGSAKKHTEL